MSKWLLRGLVLAALMVVVRLFQGILVNAFTTRAGLISLLVLLVFVITALIWGLRDGRADAQANPDPERRADLAMLWLLSALVAGIVSGVVCWFVNMFYPTMYVDSLVNELTAFAAFTALLAFLFAIIGVAVGRGLTDRRARAHEGQNIRAADEDRADTDVFAAVHDGEPGRRGAHTDYDDEQRSR
jgi:amino acid transporter